MFRLKKIGGEKVSSGNYWNFSTGERITLDREGTLPGKQSVVYYKFPPAVMLIAGPLLGLIYAVFLPFIGIAMLFAVLAKKVFGGVFAGVFKGATFGWKPSEAYLAGKKAKSKKAEKTESKETKDE